MFLPYESLDKQNQIEIPVSSNVHKSTNWPPLSTTSLPPVSIKKSPLPTKIKFLPCALNSPFPLSSSALHPPPHDAPSCSIPLTFVVPALMPLSPGTTKVGSSDLPLRKPLELIHLGVLLLVPPNLYNSGPCHCSPTLLLQLILAHLPHHCSMAPASQPLLPQNS